MTVRSTGRDTTTVCGVWEMSKIQGNKIKTETILTPTAGLLNYKLYYYYYYYYYRY